MGLEEYKGVYVFAQQVDNELSGIAFELLGKAKELASDLGTDVTAVLIGSDVKGLTDELAEYGADKVIVVDDPELKEYRTEPYAHALSSVINEYKPEIVLVGATAIGRDLGPRVSARVQTGLTADCTVLEIGDFPINAIPGQEDKQKHNQLLMTRPAFGGNTIATIACPDNRPQMATVRPGVMQKIEPVKGAKAEVIEYNPGFTPNNKYVEILDIVKDLSVIVTVGWSIFSWPDMIDGGRYLKTMFGLDGAGIGNSHTAFMLLNYRFVLLMGIIGSTSLAKRLSNRILPDGTLRREILAALFVFLILGICMAYLINSSYNPFLYFRF